MTGRFGDDEARLGTSVGHVWQVERIVGQGTTAVVYAARHVNGATAALKVLRRRHLENGELVSRFRQEAEIARVIRHYAVVEVWGLAHTDDGVPFLMMELLEGETLAQAMRRGLVPLTFAIDAACDVLAGLEACHALSVVHRDLKPSNVFVTAEGRAKLLDFGTARQEGRGTTNRRLAIGTPEFMAPEQARGAVDTRSDVFCVGTLLYALLTHSLPRIGDSDDEVVALAAREPMPSVAKKAPEIPRALADIVDRALQWSAKERWPSARAFADALVALDRAMLLRADARRIRREDTPTIPGTPSAIRAVEGTSAIRAPKVPRL